MLIIEHRRNSLEEASNVSNNYGAEIDLRGSMDGIYLAHDWLSPEVYFQDWLKCFSGTFVIANIKEIGIEDKVVELMQQAGIGDNYFLLDLPTPSLVRAIRSGFRCAARVSELESLTDALKLETNWLWIDSFTGSWDHLKEALNASRIFNKKTCLVSPELQGRALAEDGIEYREILAEINNSNRLDAVCTKFPNFWIGNVDVKK